MAVKLSIATGNFATAGTWSDAWASGQQLTGSSTTSLTTSAQYSANVAGDNSAVRYVILKLAARPASPGAETVTFTLRNKTDNADAATVTINKSDLPADGDCWIAVDWGSSKTLTTGKNWGIGIVTSATTSGTTSFYRDATTANWDLAHFLNAASGAAPTTGDTIYILGQRTGAGAITTRTVTIDQNSATAIGDINVGDGGTSVDSSGATVLLTTSGNHTTWAGGTFNRGTSGARLNASNTSTYDFTGTAKGYIIKNGATVNFYGASISSGVIDRLSSTANSAQAVAVTGSDHSADWNQWGKLVCYAATTFNSTRQHEQLTVSSISTTSITHTGNFSNQHLGTNASGNDMRAHVGFLSRNCITRWNGASATAGYIQINNTATVNMSFAEFTTTSSGTFGANTSSQRGLDIQTTTGSCSITDCSIHDTGAATSAAACIITGSTANNITFQRNIVYNHIGTSAVGLSIASTSGTNYTIDSNLFVGITTGAGTNCMTFGDAGGTLTNNIANGVGTSSSANVTSSGCIITDTDSFGTVSGWICYCNPNAGLQIATSCSSTVGRASRQTISSFTCWRNNNIGYQFSQSGGEIYGSVLTLSSCVGFGNVSEIRALLGPSFGTLLLNCTFDEGTTVTSTQCINVTSNSNCIGLIAVGCAFGSNQSFTNFLATSVNNPIRFTLESYGSSLTTTTLISNQSSMHWDSYIESYNHNGSAGDYRLATKNGSGFNEVSDTTHGEHATCRALTPNIGSNANDNNCEHWLEGMPAISGTAPQPTFRLKSFSSWNGKAYVTIFFKGQIVTGPTEVTGSINSSTFTNCSVTGSNPGENGHFDYRLTYSGATGGLYLDAEGDAALETIS